MREIELIGGDKALVDDEDYEWLSEYIWIFCARGNSRYTICANSKKEKPTTMHRLIMKKYHGMSPLVIDHIDHNGLNNQKNNLRYATHGENMYNKRKWSKNTSSKYKGVFKRRDDQWRMMIVKDKKRECDRVFLTERDAAIAYDIKAKELFGEFACLNILDAKKHEVENIRKILDNPTKRNGCSSKYLGVCKRKKWWTAHITNNAHVTNINKRTLYIGRFKTEEEAAIAYNLKSIELYGDEAKINIINEED